MFILGEGGEGGQLGEGNTINLGIWARHTTGEVVGQWLFGRPRAIHGASRTVRWTCAPSRRTATTRHYCVITPASRRLRECACNTFDPYQVSTFGQPRNSRRLGAIEGCDVSDGIRTYGCI